MFRQRHANSQRQFASLDDRHRQLHEHAVLFLMTQQSEGSRVAQASKHFQELLARIIGKKYWQELLARIIGTMGC
jgi:hypothetical protein